jgi:hypothetical protein
MKKRTASYIATIPMKNVEQVIEVKKTLQDIFGWVVLRGRHSDRKKVLGDNWGSGTQNDVPWRKAEYIDVYLHPENPNYQSVCKGKGIQRQNLQSIHNWPVMALGKAGLGFYDDYINKLTIKAQHSEKRQRKLKLEKYVNKARKLQEGDWGYIAQSILDFVQQKYEVTFTEMKTYYDVVLRGQPQMMQGGSFIHHLHSLIDKNNVKGRRCNRLLYKSVSGKYKVTTQK